MYYYYSVYNYLMYAHLVTVIPCVGLGGYLLLFRKGTVIHRYLGKIYMLLMLITACITLFMPALVGPRIFNHFGWIHLFTALTIWTVPTAYIAIRKGDIKKHQRKMVLLYLGALIIAGGFTFVPGRYMHELVFG